MERQLRTLVAKGDWNAIWKLHSQLQIDQLPKQSRITIEVFEVPADGSPLTEKSVPAALLSCVSLSGQEVEAVHQQEGKMIHVKATAYHDVENRTVDLQLLELSCALPGHPEMDVESSLTFQPGKSLWVARDFDGNKGLDMRISATIELTDGTPVAEAFLIQHGNSAMPMAVDRKENKRHRVGDKGWLAVQWSPPGIIGAIMQQSSGDSGDPPPKDKSERLVILEVQVPDVLKPWFNRPVLDLREFVKKSGTISTDFTGFAGYDELAQRLFIFSNDEMDLGKFEQLTFTNIDWKSQVVVTLDGNGQSRLVARTGALSRLVRQVGDEKIIRSLEIEPNASANGLINIRLEAVDNTKATRAGVFKSVVTLRSGEPFAVLAGSDGKESSLRIKAEIVEVSE